MLEPELGPGPGTGWHSESTPTARTPYPVRTIPPQSSAPLLLRLRLQLQLRLRLRIRLRLTPAPGPALGPASGSGFQYSRRRRRWLSSRLLSYPAAVLFSSRAAAVACGSTGQCPHLLRTVPGGASPDRSGAHGFVAGTESADWPESARLDRQLGGGGGVISFSVSIFCVCPKLVCWNRTQVCSAPSLRFTTVFLTKQVYYGGVPGPTDTVGHRRNPPRSTTEFAAVTALRAIEIGCI